MKRRHVEAWGYGEEDGPSTWPSKFPKAGGCRQSPVDIVRKSAVYESWPVKGDHQPLTISYQAEDDMTIGNNGHTVKAECKRKESTLTGGPLGKDIYRLAQFHLHWGSKNDKGSEHTIDGKQYSAEIHLVHWNSSKYDSMEKASTEDDGLAVLCVLVQIENKHEKFDVIVRNLKNVNFKDDSWNLSDDTFDPSWLLPTNTERFWTYPGSLTTPPCYESVKFIVFEEVSEFSQEQIDELRSLRTGGKQSEHMEDNFRPICDLGDRTVQASFKTSSADR